MLKLSQRKEKIGRYEPQWNSRQVSWKVSLLRTTCNFRTEATTTAGTPKTLPVSPFGLPLYKVEVCFYYNGEIISERKCEILVPFILLVALLLTQSATNLICIACVFMWNVCVEKVNDPPPSLSVLHTHPLLVIG